MKTSGLVVLLLFPAAFSSGATELYKCRGVDGRIAYQANPCPEAKGQSTVRPTATPATTAPGSAFDVGIYPRSKMLVSASGVKAERQGDNVRFTLEKVSLAVPEGSPYADIRYKDIDVYIYKRTSGGNEFMDVSEKKRVEGVLSSAKARASYGPLELWARNIAGKCQEECFIVIQVLIWYGEWQSSAGSAQVDLRLR